MTNRTCPHCGPSTILKFYRYPQQMLFTITEGDQWAKPGGSVQEWDFNRLQQVSHAQCASCARKWLPDGRPISHDPSRVVMDVMSLLHDGVFDWDTLKDLLDKTVRSPVQQSEMP